MTDVFCGPFAILWESCLNPWPVFMIFCFRHSRAWLPGLLMLALVFPRLHARSVSELSLHEVLELALQRGELVAENVSTPPYQASSWLAGLPSLSLSYLGSDQRLGTDETELSLNLPVKSGRRRSADKKLQGLITELDEVGQRRRELYYSGLIREATWSYRLADTRRRFANDKRQILLELERRQSDLVAASAASEYALLLVQSELVEVEISQQVYLQEARRWLQRFRQVTGLGEVPADIGEVAPEQTQFQPGQHPQMRRLELAHAQRRQVLRANSLQAADWNLSLTAKNLDTAGYDEQQYGLGVEIPLSGVNVARQVDDSAWRSGERDYLIARDQLLNQLHTSYDALLGERETLRQKQELLVRSSQLSQRIASQLEQLRASNEIAQEIVLRRMMAAIDTRAEVKINQLLIEQNNAMLRQAAGISL